MERGGVVLEIRAINFDWPGELGKAKYPQSLNENIFWPDESGELERKTWSCCTVRLTSSRSEGCEIFVPASLESA